jgi:iron transport multicopper oxidase
MEPSFLAELQLTFHSAFFNNITYKPPVVPTLYTVMSAGEQAVDSRVYGDYTHSFVLEKDQVVQIVVNNDDPGKHPFHLHGHAFQVIWRSDEEAGYFDPTANNTFPEVPMKRDTVTVHPQGNMVLRFKADNPGVWLFHCHIEWHVNSGLIATMIEAPLEIQKTLEIPTDHIAACEAIGTPYKGNAAGNTVNLLDLTGQNAPPDPLPEG